MRFFHDAIDEGRSIFAGNGISCIIIVMMTIHFDEDIENSLRTVLYRPLRVFQTVANDLQVALSRTWISGRG